jgi:hypothetical protein
MVKIDELCHKSEPTFRPPPPLTGSQGHNGIQAGGPLGWHNPKKETNATGNGDGDQNGTGGNNSGNGGGKTDDYHYPHPH